MMSTRIYYSRGHIFINRDNSVVLLDENGHVEPRHNVQFSGRKYRIFGFNGAITIDSEFDVRIYLSDVTVLVADCRRIDLIDSHVITCNINVRFLEYNQQSIIKPQSSVIKSRLYPQLNPADFTQYGYKISNGYPFVPVYLMNGSCMQDKPRITAWPIFTQYGKSRNIKPLRCWVIYRIGVWRFARIKNLTKDKSSLISFGCFYKFMEYCRRVITIENSIQ